MKKPHGNTGKQNRLKGVRVADARLSARIDPVLKAEAMALAADRGYGLSELVCNLIIRELESENPQR